VHPLPARTSTASHRSTHWRGLRSLPDLFDGRGHLVRHLVHEHTTLRVRNDADANRSRWPLHPRWRLLPEHDAQAAAQGVVREVDPDQALLEQMMPLAIAVESYLKRTAPVECMRRGREVLSHDATLREFSLFLRRVRDPLTWWPDAVKRSDQTRRGPW
jgi:hypothetical protein